MHCLINQLKPEVLHVRQLYGMLAMAGESGFKVNRKQAVEKVREHVVIALPTFGDKISGTQQPEKLTGLPGTVSIKITVMTTCFPFHEFSTA